MRRQDEVAVKVCQYYYLDRMTMSQIGDRLGLSRHKVGRILSSAVSSGLVKIEIQQPLSHSAALERALISELGLKAAVVPNLPGPLAPAELKQRVGAAAAQLISSMIGAGEVVGVGWGSTSFEVARQITGNGASGVKVVQITGGNGAVSARFSCQDVTRTVAANLGVEPTLLHAPAIVANRQTRDLLLREPMIQEVTGLFGKISLSLVGIGTLQPMASALAESGMIPQRELDAIVALGAVGDVYSCFIDAAGRPVETELSSRMIAIGLDEIRRIPRSIAVATGQTKATAVRAAVAAGLTNILVVDEALAEAVLELGPPAAR